MILNLFYIDAWMSKETSDFQSFYNVYFIVCGHTGDSMA